MHQATLYAGMTTLTSGALVELIAQLGHHRRDSRHDLFYFRGVPLVPRVLPRRALHDAGGTRVERGTAFPDRVVERQLQSFEHRPEHVDRALEEILVAPYAPS